jgi:hypothetical protein
MTARVSGSSDKLRTDNEKPFTAPLSQAKVQAEISQWT